MATGRESKTEAERESERAVAGRDSDGQTKWEGFGTHFLRGGTLR
uniref:Uncharacterized protein n=1 Tax=Cucumis melo TaxID=3656 RepID=A0A9I9DYD0_CUCME